MYRCTPGLTFGFHGCEEYVRDAVVSGKDTLKYSQNKYDWLGPGIYFWENDPERALDFAKNHPARKIKRPAVLGAVIDPGYCLNLLNSADRYLLRKSRDTYLRPVSDFSTKLLTGLSNLRNANAQHDLDCYIIERLHVKRHSLGQAPFESVRNAFTEGPELYPGAAFQDKTHIQLCVRNPNCIKAFFIPRLEVDWPSLNESA